MTTPSFKSPPSLWRYWNTSTELLNHLFTNAGKRHLAIPTQTAHRVFQGLQHRARSTQRRKSPPITRCAEGRNWRNPGGRRRGRTRLCKALDKLAKGHVRSQSGFSGLGCSAEELTQGVVMGPGGGYFPWVMEGLPQLVRQEQLAASPTGNHRLGTTRGGAVQKLGHIQAGAKTHVRQHKKHMSRHFKETRCKKKDLLVKPRFSQS